MKARIVKFVVWCLSPEGRKDIGAVSAAILLAWQALNKAGVFS